MTSDSSSTIIHSLTFQSNKRTYGPFGNETGRKFSFPATGGKIIGFYGSSGSHLESLGAYFEPISHLYPIEFIGPFGGQGGHHWDDGKFNGVKKIKMMLEDVVSYISIEYDDNDESIWSSTHGHSGNGDTHMVSSLHIFICFPSIGSLFSRMYHSILPNPSFNDQSNF